MLRVLFPVCFEKMMVSLHVKEFAWVFLRSSKDEWEKST